MNRKIRTTRRRVSSGSSAQSTSIRLTFSPTKKENGESSPKQLTKMCKNPLVSEVCTRMYENKEKTGDVKFKIGTDEISAHKCVLASLSPKYEAQFYGEFDDTKSDVIEVKDVTADAFKEYLQFFYLNEFPLTHANIEHVLSLAELSLVEEFVDECINFLIETLSVETVCLTYCVAIKHGCEDVIELCERKISLHSDEVFASKDFVSSSREVIFNILQLDSLNCKETDVFNACIKWAKHVCTEKESDPDVKMNLRAALVPETPTQATNLLHQIRFGAMSIEEFMECYKSYKDIFTEAEREEIFYIIGKVHAVPPKWFSDELRGIPYKKWDEDNKIECNRIFSETSLASFHFGIDRVAFSCNKPMLLGGFYCGSLFEDTNVKHVSAPNVKHVPANVVIVRKHMTKDVDGKIVFNSDEELIFKTKEEASVKLQRPIFIKPHLIYEIQIALKEGISLKKYEFKKENTLNGGILVEYHNEGQKSLVTCLILNCCNEGDKTMNSTLDFKAHFLTKFA